MVRRLSLRRHPSTYILLKERFGAERALFLVETANQEVEMQIADLCRESVTVVRRGTSIHEAAELMRRYHIGTVVVVDIEEGAEVPVGIVTDRDIVVGVVA